MEKIEIILSTCFFYEIFKGTLHLFKHIVESGSNNMIIFLIATNNLFMYIQENLDIVLKIIHVCDTQLLKYVFENIKLNQVSLNSCLLESSFNINVDNFIYLYTNPILKPIFDLETTIRCLGIILNRNKIKQITKIITYLDEYIFDFIVEHDLTILTCFILLYNKGNDVIDDCIEKILGKIPKRESLYLVLFEKTIRHMMPLSLINKLLYIIQPDHNDIYSIYKHHRIRYFDKKEVWNRHLLLLIQYGFDSYDEFIYEDSEGVKHVEDYYKKMRIRKYSSHSQLNGLSKLPLDLLKEVLSYI